jgi:hypothetical protein
VLLLGSWFGGDEQLVACRLAAAEALAEPFPGAAVQGNSLPKVQETNELSFG